MEFARALNLRKIVRVSICLKTTSYLLIFLLLFLSNVRAQECTLVSGASSLRTCSDSGDGTQSLVFEGSRDPQCQYFVEHPLWLQVNEEKLEGRYQKTFARGGTLFCEGSLKSQNGTQFVFRDTFRAGLSGAFEMERSVEVQNESPLDLFFNSALNIKGRPAEPLQNSEVFVPGVWYRTNFKTQMQGVLAADPNDRDFVFREDRLPLPVVMLRKTEDGSTLSLVHVEADPTTFSGDRGAARVVDARMQFGSLGVRQFEGTALTFMFPGSEGEKNHVERSAPGGWAYRSHPVKTETRHHYKLLIALSQTASYSDAVEGAWKRAFNVYQPRVRPVELKAAFQGLVETLDFYAVGSKQGYDAPGFPFSVRLPDGSVRAYNYQMGFIGRQLPNAFILIHQGLEQGRPDMQKKGEEIIDFWAEESLLSSGLPRTWYNPSNKENSRGFWRKGDTREGGSAMRTAATGMEGMLSAWNRMKLAHLEKPAWLEACRRFGDWLVENQNDDGSYYLAYQHELNDGRNLPSNASKSTSSNVIRFLAMLHFATGDARYRRAAVRAGVYCLETIHVPYHYAGSVIDNPNAIDRESGQEALSSFLALYDLTHEKRWLEPAVQAARYTETWMYAYEVPAAIGVSATVFPADRSIVGQTLIAAGHSAADLGLAFSAFDYYRLFLFTEDAHFLEIAKLLVYNTKQSLNWDASLYPGKPKGLQIEAFSVTVPRRQGISECLSWNYTAHLDPLIRFQDKFGSMDIDEIEQQPREKLRERNESVSAFR